MHDQIIPAGDVKRRSNERQVAQVIKEAIDGLALLPGQFDQQQGFDVHAERLYVDIGVGTFQQAARPQ